MSSPNDWGLIHFLIMERMGCHFGGLTLPQLRNALGQIARMPGQPVILVEPPQRSKQTDL